MSTLLDQVQALLAPLAAGGAWLGVNTAQPKVLPYLVHQIAGHDPNSNFDGAGDLQYFRLQVDVYAQSAAEARAIARAAQSALQASALAAAPLPGLGGPLPDEETRLMRVSNDYGIWSAD